MILRQNLILKCPMIRVNWKLDVSFYHYFHICYFQNKLICKINIFCKSHEIKTQCMLSKITLHLENENSLKENLFHYQELSCT